MAEQEKKPVSLNELMVSTLAMADATAKLFIEKGIFTEAESSRSSWRNGRHTSGF
jgi:hypothetical protein